MKKNGNGKNAAESDRYETAESEKMSEGGCSKQRIRDLFAAAPLFAGGEIFYREI